MSRLDVPDSCTRGPQQRHAAPSRRGRPVAGRAVVFPDAGGARGRRSGRWATGWRGMGYVALIPDIYYRAGTWAPFDVATLFTSDQERARLGELTRVLTNDRVIADSGAYADFLLARPEVTGSAIGTTRYCPRRRMSQIAAARLGPKAAAAAPFHGGRLAVADDPSSPHLPGRPRQRHGLRGRLAQDDNSFTAGQAELLARALTDAGGQPHRRVLPRPPRIRGARQPRLYDAQAGTRHWAALRDLYRASLQRP